MIEVTYLFHSGFAVEMTKCILVFDYWMDPSGALERILSKQEDKPVYVLASHFHSDHFNRQILTWRETYPTTRFTYLLSKDILKHRRAEKTDADAWLAKGARWQDELIQITATGSNDSGVSWIVEAEGRCLFHAGDLCNWYARFLSEDKVPETVCSEEFGLINPIAEEKQFLGELKDIRKITDKFDLVMFPVDGRIGNGYTLGARQFIERFEVGLFVPMHFVASGFESAWRMQPFCQEKGIPFWCIREEGEQITLLQELWIRHATEEDIPRMNEIFAIARKFMVETGNPTQWLDNYPTREMLQEDMSTQSSFVCMKGTEMVGTFVLLGGDDPTYEIIYEGAWPNNHAYGTIHRIASSRQVKGIFQAALDYALLHYSTIRIDTHKDNKAMRSAVTKAGFQYCGIIHCWDGSPRVAYQL